MEKEPSKNVLGGDLTPCSMDPVTGFFRNGSCDTCAEDRGESVVSEVFAPTNESVATSESVVSEVDAPPGESVVTTGESMVSSVFAPPGEVRPAS